MGNLDRGIRTRSDRQDYHQIRWLHHRSPDISAVRLGWLVMFGASRRSAQDGAIAVSSKAASRIERRAYSGTRSVSRSPPARPGDGSCESRRPACSSQTPPQCAAHPPAARVAGMMGPSEHRLPITDGWCSAPRAALRCSAANRRHPPDVVGLIGDQRDPVIGRTGRARLRNQPCWSPGQTSVDHYSMSILHQKVVCVRFSKLGMASDRG